MANHKRKPDSHSGSGSKLKGILSAVVGSACLWTLLCLVFADYAVTTLKPLKYIEDPYFLPMDKHPIVSKIPEYLESKKTPDVLVLGSSLPMIAVAAWDEKYAQSLKWTPSALRRYTKAVYLEKLLKDRNKEADVFNLTINAAMVSDVSLIVDYAVKNSKEPKKIIYCMCPRAFIANDAYPVGKSPVYRVLSNWDSINQTILNAKSIADVRDGVLFSFWNFYKSKADYRHVATVAACRSLDREPTIFQAQQRAKKEALESKDGKSNKCEYKPIVNNLESNLIPDLAVYKKVYNPPNFERFEKERKYLAKLMSTCKNQGIELAIVNMPITAENKKLLNTKLYSDYLTSLVSLSRKFDCQYLDLDKDKSFVSSDFHDSVHVNWKGGKKVQEKLVESLSSSNYL